MFITAHFRYNYPINEIKSVFLFIFDFSAKTFSNDDGLKIKIILKIMHLAGSFDKSKNIARKLR